MRKALMGVVLLVAAMAPALINTVPVQAHGSCYVVASFDGPSGAGKWRGYANEHCTTGHPLLFVRTELQSRNCQSCDWNTVGDFGYDICTAGNQTDCDTFSDYKYLCSDKQYRIHGEAYVKSGSGTEHNNDIDNSSVRDGSHVGDGCGP